MVLEPEFRPVQRAEVSTTDEAEAEEFIRQQYVENHARFLSAPESGRLSATAAQACGIAGDDFRSSIDYSAACDPFDYYLFFTMFNGRLRFTCGGDDTIVLAGECSFYPLGVPLTVHVSDQAAQILRLPADRLEMVAEQTAGINAADLRFHAATPVSAQMAARWMALTDLAGSMLADAAGVTGRALQYAFRRHYDATPMGYLRRVRLERAHAELSDANPASGITVQAVARRWGWASLRQFTTAYQQRFGVLPGRTLGA